VSRAGAGAENGPERARKSGERDRGLKNTVEREQSGSGSLAKRERSSKRGLQKEV